MNRAPTIVVGARSLRGSTYLAISASARCLYLLDHGASGVEEVGFARLDSYQLGVAPWPPEAPW